MTITISSQAWEDLEQEVEKTAQSDLLDPLDVTWQYPKSIGHGYIRQIELRQGLELEILNCRLHDRLITDCPERPNGLKFHFHLSGQHEDKLTVVGDREFALYGSGLAPKELNDGPKQKALEVEVYMQPETLCSFIGNSTEQLPTELQQLIRPVEQENYTRVAKVTPFMESVMWQILRCPYQGITKRMYLESKVLELVSLVLEQESEIQKGERAIKPLNAGTLERIHYARTLLLQNLHHPPSLPDLAKQAKLNEYTLKRGFRQVFGTTVFAYLHKYRLEQARQLLETGYMCVTEVMQAVGFVDRHHFAGAFRKQFGVSPREFLIRFKRSV